FHAPVVRIDSERVRPIATLRDLVDDELLVRTVVKQRVDRISDTPPRPFDWGAQFDRWLAASGVRARAADVEARARAEKVAALQTLFHERFSILTGRAGTGKTSVLQVLLDGLEQLDGRKQVLLLAPTGKARVRLSTRSGRDASTIHQLLLRSGWLDSET